MKRKIKFVAITAILFLALFMQGALMSGSLWADQFQENAQESKRRQDEELNKLKQNSETKSQANGKEKLDESWQEMDRKYREEIRKKREDFERQEALKRQKEEEEANEKKNQTELKRQKDEQWFLGQHREWLKSLSEKGFSEPLLPEEFLGSYQEEKSGTVGTIEPMYHGEKPEFVLLRGRHLWSGEYKKEGKFTFKYTPKSDEMNPEAPEWARKKVEQEGKLIWVMELEPSKVCTDHPTLEGFWYPGEIEWEGDEAHATAEKGKAVPVKLFLHELTEEDNKELTGAPFIKLRVKDMPFTDTPEAVVASLSQYLSFYIEVSMDKKSADKAGDSIMVTVHSFRRDQIGRNPTFSRPISATDQYGPKYEDGSLETTYSPFSAREYTHTLYRTRELHGVVYYTEKSPVDAWWDFAMYSSDKWEQYHAEILEFIYGPVKTAVSIDQDKEVKGIYSARLPPGWVHSYPNEMAPEEAAQSPIFEYPGEKDFKNPIAVSPVNSKGMNVQAGDDDTSGVEVLNSIRRDVGFDSLTSRELLRVTLNGGWEQCHSVEELTAALRAHGGRAAAFNKNPSFNQLQLRLAAQQKIAFKISAGDLTQPGIHWVRLEALQCKNSEKTAVIGDPWTGKSWEISYSTLKRRMIPGTVVAADFS